ncbi:hypothetical protein B0H17DRAFT_1134138 [Mycena rosella]|uniref:Uncharacterized protein n=1 Tax=Mycena rosella TaxID=1033263 RepID=A0AAD7DGK6_MYCRO|nr:hypothetical protein B0H17DRAFT_1134138 [Mycena rosella]
MSFTRYVIFSLLYLRPRLASGKHSTVLNPMSTSLCPLWVSPTDIRHGFRPRNTYDPTTPDYPTSAYVDVHRHVHQPAAHDMGRRLPPDYPPKRPRQPVLLRPRPRRALISKLRSAGRRPRRSSCWGREMYDLMQYQELEIPRHFSLVPCSVQMYTGLAAEYLCVAFGIAPTAPHRHPSTCAAALPDVDA